MQFLSPTMGGSGIACFQSAVSLKEFEVGVVPGSEGWVAGVVCDDEWHSLLLCLLLVRQSVCYGCLFCLLLGLVDCFL